MPGSTRVSAGGRVACFWIPEFRIGALFWIADLSIANFCLSSWRSSGQLAGWGAYFQGRVCIQSRARLLNARQRVNLRVSCGPQQASRTDQPDRPVDGVDQSHRRF
ncbi:hypothetical protein BM449_07990 [Synechococcus sp. SynAce01]|nr:hypothetical protein BM449_07990 [Synechococcus sp. SynAce01]